jgi:ankyrin repeat protein
MPRGSVIDKLNAKLESDAKKLPIFADESAQIFDKALDKIRNFEQFIQMAAIGNPKSIGKMRKLIRECPYSQSRGDDDPNHILNRPDRFGRRPIDVAVQNGNMLSVRFLIQQKCIFDTKTEKATKESELPFMTAARWNHLNIVEYFLTITDYDPSILKAALEQTSSKVVKRSIEENLERRGFHVS